MAHVDKIIVSNRGALSKKYGAQALLLIERAVDDLIESDRKRRLLTKLCYLDDIAIRRIGGRPVRDAVNARGNKNAIDSLCRHYSPDYIMILGAPDVVPHLKVTNLTRDEDGRIIDSDLPYACDAPFHRDARRFLAPTRVVGRLPDINGGRDPEYLIGLLENAKEAKRRPPKDYSAWFALSTQSWTGSSAITAANLFSGLDGLSLCPPTRPSEHKTLPKTRIHFFNCHGGDKKHVFWGEQGRRQPVSFRSSSVPSQLLPGTVIAAECCYGAQLYAPARAHISISAAYLQRKAAAYVGSTTIAYGPEEGQGDADLLTQYFIQFVLRGHSVGRAFLQARQKYLTVSAPRIGAVELKTISQFLLLGDPSIHLVEKRNKSLVIEKGALLMESKKREGFFRRERRLQLATRGHSINSALEKPRAGGQQVSPARHRAFSKLARENGLRDFVASILRFGDRKDPETHYSYVERRTRHDSRRARRIVVFKERGTQIDVRVYRSK
jgi:peptidase C25-like protein